MRTEYGPKLFVRVVGLFCIFARSDVNYLWTVKVDVITKCLAVMPSLRGACCVLQIVVEVACHLLRKEYF